MYIYIRIHTHICAYDPSCSSILTALVFTPFPSTAPPSILETSLTDVSAVAAAGEPPSLLASPRALSSVLQRVRKRQATIAALHQGACTLSYLVPLHHTQPYCCLPPAAGASAASSCAAISGVMSGGATSCGLALFTCFGPPLSFQPSPTLSACLLSNQHPFLLLFPPPALFAVCLLLPCS